MYCIKCGRQINLGSKFCDGCGNLVVINPNETPRNNFSGLNGANISTNINGPNPVTNYNRPNPVANNNGPNSAANNSRPYPMANSNSPYPVAHNNKPNPVAYNTPATKQKPKIAPIVISFSLALIMLIMYIPLAWWLGSISPYSPELLAGMGTVIVSGEMKSGFRDERQVGNGTITFIKDDYFAAVAHSVPAIPSPSLTGYHFYNAEVMGISNEELQIANRDGIVWGEMLYNLNEGVFGRVSNMANITNMREMEIGTATIGRAQMLATHKPGPPQLHDIEITWVDEYNTDSNLIDSRNIWWKAIDPDFPGVYEGNSGSPIIQNGKLVGAVSNVLATDRSEGAATSAARMIGVFEENHFGISSISDAVASQKLKMMVTQVIYWLVIVGFVILGIVGIVRAVNVSKKSKINRNAAWHH